MKTKLVEDIAAAVLYEGYLLYPYRTSAVKNQKRWNFGVLYPPAYTERQAGADASMMETACLVVGPPAAKLSVRVRFLQVDSTGARERDVVLPPVTLEEMAASQSSESFGFDGLVSGVIAKSAEQLGCNVFRIRVTISNTTSFYGADREEALAHSLVSTHTMLGIEDGKFVSLLEPPAEFSSAAAGCKNIGTWPVLVGEAGARDAMLSSPIILYDYPKIAPESPGALFDGTEIDEILTLRIMTLTDQEKLEMANADERTREILERTESMPAEQFMKLHGVLREMRPAVEEKP